MLQDFIYQAEEKERKWLKKRGKKGYGSLLFDESERLELKKYFHSLDDQKQGCIGVEELEDPLIALGLASSRKQVENMITLVDTDKSGKIEFNEFLSILRGGDQSGMAAFFKCKILNLEILSGKVMKDVAYLPFKHVVSNYRRKIILDSIKSQDPEKKIAGERVLKAFTASIAYKKQNDFEKRRKEYYENLANEDESFSAFIPEKYLKKTTEEETKLPETTKNVVHQEKFQKQKSKKQIQAQLNKTYENISLPKVNQSKTQSQLNLQPSKYKKQLSNKQNSISTKNSRSHLII